MVVKICIYCGHGKEESVDNFYFRKELGKFRNACIICHQLRYDEYRKNNIEKLKANDREYYRKNKEKRLDYNKKYYEENKNKILNSVKNYQNKNKDKISERKNKAYRNRIKNDPIFKLRRLASRLINFAIKRNENSKHGESIIKYLPYTMEELKKHLESLFEPWMNWDNHGKYITSSWVDNNPSTWKWNIDHIIPQSELPYDSMKHPNFQKCWALKNLRPLNAKQNILDGNRKHKF